MTTVVLPRALIALFPGAERRVDVDASTVAGVLDVLDDEWPGMRDRLRDDVGLRPHINVFVDGERAGLGTAVQPGSTVHVIPAISGG
ncbi:MAG: MoaD/ThiS family protein [Chloroflexi bacterium]|jgi:molybdopterin converting factor small subunit|nr:MoaD/ThiS family protein [Chloroflexota bacterium]